MTESATRLQCLQELRGWNGLPACPLFRNWAVPKPSDRCFGRIVFWRLVIGAIYAILMSHSIRAQDTSIILGNEVSGETRQIYARGLQYLASSQAEDGNWPGGMNGPAISGLCVMAFLAQGDDPNFGPYAVPIRKAVQSILERQDRSTGYYGESMYHHGFAMLAIAEAYGAVDESLLWDGNSASQASRSLASSLDLAVRCAVTAQKRNQAGGWRYSPDSVDADTSVSGAVLMGLLAARNAGMEVPDECIDGALKYFQASTSEDGSVAYSGEMGGMGASMNRSSIATLVYAVGRRKDWKEYTAALDHIVSQKDDIYREGYPSYFRYYMSQALFQGNPQAWKDWKDGNAAEVAQLQQEDGSIPDNFSPACGTAMYLLSLALEFRYLPIYER